MNVINKAHPTRRRNPRGQGGRLKEEIVSAASEMIAQSGDASQLSLRGVAKRVGISAPSIYSHFVDVEHLKMAVVEQAFADFGLARDAVSEDPPDQREALLARCRSYCQFALDNPGPYRFMFSNEAPHADDGSLLGSEAIEALATSIRRCQDAGVAGAREDPMCLAVQIWSALHGAVLLWMNVQHFPWPTSLFEMVDLAVRRLLILNSV